MSLKVVQWTSGGVARQAVRAIIAHPALELVGMYAHSERKVGIDAGELVGLEPLGISASNDIAKLIALAPHCVSYSPLYPDIDHLVQLLEAGINIVTTCNFITGWGVNLRQEKYGPDACARIEAAAQQGGASIFGTGINPGHINYMACIMSAYCQDIQQIKVTESVDVFNFVGDANMDDIGFGLPPNSPGHDEMIRRETSVFGDAIQLMARMMDTRLDDICCKTDYAYATEDIDAPGRFIAQGHVGGVKIRWQGLVDGKVVFENRQVWIAGTAIDTDWKVQHGYIIDIQGNPNLHNVMIPIPQGDLSQMRYQDFNALGMRITALPSINAIAAVCAAAPGIVTYNDLPPITGCGRIAAHSS